MPQNGFAPKRDLLWVVINGKARDEQISSASLSRPDIAEVVGEVSNGPILLQKSVAVSRE